MIRRVRRHWLTAATIWVALCVFHPCRLFAQRYPFYNLNVENGIVQSQANCMMQDRYGNLWTGTLGGLSRYDGKTFTNYSVRNGLLSNAIFSMDIDNRGNIWVGGTEGISVFNGKSFTYYRFHFKDNQVEKRVSAISKGNGDTVWCKAGGKIFYISTGKVNALAVPGEDSIATALLADSEGLWISKIGVVYRWAHSKWDTIRCGPGADERMLYVEKIYKDKHGQIWLPSVGGLYRIANRQIVPYQVRGMMLANNMPTLTSMTCDPAGSIWLGCNSGVIRIADSMIEYFNKRNGLTDNVINDVLTDAEGNVWMASDGQGIYRFSGMQFTELDESMGLASSQVMAFAADYFGKLYLGTYDAGLYAFQDGKVSPIAFPFKPVPVITSMLVTRDQKLWIGTRNRGLWRYYNNVFREYSFPEHHFPSNSISALYQDTSKTLWIGFVNGLVIFRHDTFRAVPRLHTPISSFLPIAGDSMLMATGSGLKVYVDSVVLPYITHTLVDTAEVMCMTMRGRDIWFGTNDYGAIRYNLDTHQTLVINKGKGLQSDFIYNVIVDNDGNVWLGTGYGIHRVSFDSKGSPLITFYGKAQGVTGAESNENAVIKMRDGSIWFGTTNGAMHYKPHAEMVSSQPISIIMQSVKLFGENIVDTTYFDSTDRWYGVPYGLHLPYKKNNITFTFQAVSLSGGQQLLYRYKIDGLDAPWSVWAPTNSVTYSALPPGKYTFRVECMPGTGMKVRELTYPFEIITPFQKTKWFRYMVFAACILLGVTLQYIANKRKEKRERLLARLRSEEQAKIRMRTAEDFHDEVGNRLTRINVLSNVLKSKINPSPDALRIIGQIQDNAGQLYSGTRDILWSLKPSNDDLYEILHRLRDFGGELFQDTDIEFSFTGTDEKWHQYRLPLDVSRNLIMIFKEALNNCLKYSKATRVHLDAHLKGRDALQLILKDNGTGFDQQTVKRGHGINNMNVRAGRINGRLYIDSHKNKGTIISLTFKLPPKR